MLSNEALVYYHNIFFYCFANILLTNYALRSNLYFVTHSNFNYAISTSISYIRIENCLKL